MMRRTALATTTAILTAGAAAAAPAQAGVPVNVGAGGKPTVAVTADGAAAVAWAAKPTGFSDRTNHCRIPRGTVTDGCLSPGAILAPVIDTMSHVVLRADGRPAIVYRERTTPDPVKVAVSNDGGATYGAPLELASQLTPAFDADGETVPWFDGAIQRYLSVAGTDSTNRDTQSFPADGGSGLDLFGPAATTGTTAGVGKLPSDLLVVADEGGLVFRTLPTGGDPIMLGDWSAKTAVPGATTADDPEIADATATQAAILGYRQAGAIHVRAFDGAAFGTLVTVPGTNGAGPRWDMTRDGSGRIHIVWQPPGFGTFWVFSNDNGATWSAPIQILPASESLLSLKVAAAPTGDGWIAYQRLDGFVFVASLEPNPIVSPPAPAPAPPLPPGAGGGGEPPRFPAKLRVRRAGVKDGRLDILAEITARATGKLKAEFESGGRTHRFEVSIPDAGVVKIDEKLPSKMRKARSGILEIDYDGNTLVRPDDVRLRAANVKANLERKVTTLKNDRLKVSGTISDRARGVVRIRLGYAEADGTVKFLRLRAKINDGKWSINEKLTGAAAQGGQLSIQFTGYLPARMRGEQTAKQVLPG